MNTNNLKKILCVEDDPDIQEVARMALMDVGGFEVDIAPSGVEALLRVDTFAPDLILLDVMMPEMDGPATLEALRARGSETPVIFMTAKVQPQEVRRYRQLGAMDVIAKPFDPMSLHETIRGIWSASHA